MKSPKPREPDPEYPMEERGDRQQVPPLRLFKIRYIGPEGIETKDVSCHFIQCLGETTMNFYESTVGPDGQPNQMLRFGVRNWIDVVEMDTIETRLVH